MNPREIDDEHDAEHEHAEARDFSGIWTQRVDDETTAIETWIAGYPGYPRQQGRTEEEARWKVQQLIESDLMKPREEALPPGSMDGPHDGNEEVD